MDDHVKLVGRGFESQLVTPRLVLRHVLEEQGILGQRSALDRRNDEEHAIEDGRHSRGKRHNNKPRGEKKREEEKKPTSQPATQPTCTPHSALLPFRPRKTA